MNRMQRVATAVVFGIAALSLCARATWAQTIHGTVRGAGQPIVGAEVRLLELDRLEHTGAQGQFTFSNVPKGTYTIFVGVAGYASATDTVQVAGDVATTAFDLKQSAIALKEVVVSASPTPKTTDELYQATDSKTQVDLLNSPGTSVAEKIEDIPGVTVRYNGSAPTRPILRGLGDNEVLVLENGLRDGDIATYDPAHATPIEAIGVSEVDVVRGPATILYGPNTIGGLVNVITNIVPTLSDHPMSGTIAIEGNTVSDEYSGFFNNVYSSGNSAFRISAGGLHADDIEIPSGTYVDPASGGAFTLNRMPQSFDHSGEAGLGYSYQGDFGMIGIGGKYFQTNYGVTGDPPNADWENIPPSTSRIQQQRHTYELRNLFNIGGGFVKQLKFDANYNDYTHSEFPTAEDSTGVSDPQANHFHKQEVNSTLQFQQQPLGNLTGALGLWSDIQNLTIEGQQPLGPNSLTTGFAGYAYEEYQTAPTTHFQAGLRYDYNRIHTDPYGASLDTTFQTLAVTRLSNAVTASLGAIQQFSPNLAGSLNFARSFRAPTVQELFANGLDAASATYSIGSASLGPEHGFGVDASLKGNYSNMTFELAPYANYIDHYIYGFLTGAMLDGFPVRQFSATNARLLGYEASVDVQATQFVALRASSDYVNAEDTQNNVPLPFIPPLRGLLRATYQDNTYMGMVEWRIAAAQNRLGVGDTPTGGYGVINLGIGKRVPQGSMVNNISLHCDNVLNKVYRDNLSVVKDFLPQPGRDLRLNYELVY
jgi:iron complex outermembrane recepter protein